MKKPEDMVSYSICRNCGYEVELWFDEQKRKCPECKEYVHKEQKDIVKDLKCANWCDSAEKCIGHNLYERIKEYLK